MSGLIRVLTSDEARVRWASCTWGACRHTPVFRLATPGGQQDFCRDCIDYAIADLPAEWLEGFRATEPAQLDIHDGIPF